MSTYVRKGSYVQNCIVIRSECNDKFYKIVFEGSGSRTRLNITKSFPIERLGPERKSCTKLNFNGFGGFVRRSTTNEPVSGLGFYIVHKTYFKTVVCWLNMFHKSHL